MKGTFVRLIAIILMLTMMITVFSACGQGDSTEGQSGEAVNIVLSGDTGSLHPHAANGDWNAVMRQIYDTPVDPKADGSLEMLLIEEIETISDTQYTLHLREGVTFSNGNPFTAEDFMFSAELARDNAQFVLQVKSIDFDKTKYN